MAVPVFFGSIASYSDTNPFRSVPGSVSFDGRALFSDFDNAGFEYPLLRCDLCTWIDPHRAAKTNEWIEA